MRIRNRIDVTIFVLIIIVGVVVMICKGAAKSAWEKV